MSLSIKSRLLEFIDDLQEAQVDGCKAVVSLLEPESWEKDRERAQAHLQRKRLKYANDTAFRDNTLKQASVTRKDRYANDPVYREKILAKKRERYHDQKLLTKHSKIAENT